MTKSFGISSVFLQVFCDNYLDGGYHVPYAHKGLASNLKLESYLTEVWPLFILNSLPATLTAISFHAICCFRICLL